MVLTRMGRKIARLTQIIENPKLFRLRQKGVSIDAFLKLNQPWLLEANINTVFDIGANVGHFTSLIHEVLPTGTIYSFEPLEDCYKKLKKRMKKMEFFRNVWKIYSGTHLSHPKISLIRGKKIEAVSAEEEKDVLIEVDGEQVGTLPATFEIIPQSILVKGHP